MEGFNLPARPGWARTARQLKLLVVASRVPSLQGRADQRTVFRLLEYLAGRGHAVHLVALATWEGRADETSLRDLCARVTLIEHGLGRALAGGLWGRLRGYPFQVGAMWNPAAQRAVAAALARERFDLSYAHLIRTAEYLGRETRPPSILAMQIAQSLHLGRMVRHARNPWRRLFYRIELDAVRRYERRVARRFDRCAVISAHDRDVIGLPPQRTWLMPHGVDTSEFRPAAGPAARGGPVIFTGVLDTPANVEALGWLCRELWPQVRARSGARLMIAGRCSGRVVRRLAARAGAELVESPPSLAPYLQQAALAVAPIRIAAGLQNKVLEAMACGLPVVATPEANEGIGARPGQELVVADPDRFADAIVTLLAEPERRRALGRAARARVERTWSWEFHWRQLEAHMLRLAAAEGPAEGMVTRP